MRQWKLLTVGAVGVIALMTALYAQEQAPGVFRTPEELQKAPAEGINSGWVVAYGVLLKRPYFVEFRDDTVWIDNVQYLPRKPNPNAKPPEVRQFSEFELRKAALRQKIADTYLEYCQTRSYEEAQRMVIEEFTQDTLVSSIEFTKSGRSFWIEYKDGQRCNMPLVIAKVESGTVITPEERMAVRRNEVNLVRRDLRRNNMFVFGFGGAEITLGPDDAEKVLSIVALLKAGTRSVVDGQTELGRLIDKPSAKEIVENIEAW